MVDESYNEMMPTAEEVAEYMEYAWRELDRFNDQVSVEDLENAARAHFELPSVGNGVNQLLTRALEIFGSR